MPRGLRNTLFYWVPIGLYLGLIFLASSFSRFPFRLPNVVGIDKLIHFAEYAVLAILVARAVRSLPRPASLLWVWLLAAGAVLAAGALDELYQSTVPHRQSDLFDLLADALGGMAGSLVYLLLTRRRWRRRPAQPTGAPSET